MIDEIDTIKSLIVILRDSLDDENHTDHVSVLIHLEKLLNELLKNSIFKE